MLEHTIVIYLNIIRFNLKGVLLGYFFLKHELFMIFLKNTGFLHIFPTKIFVFLFEYH